MEPGRRAGPGVDGLVWNELSSDEQDAAAQLQYDEVLWDSGATTRVSQITWSLLANFEQEAATRLGYEEQSWDRELNLSEARSSANTPLSSGWEIINSSQGQFFYHAVSGQTSWALPSDGRSA